MWSFFRAWPIHNRVAPAAAAFYRRADVRSLGWSGCGPEHRPRRATAPNRPKPRAPLVLLVCALAAKRAGTKERATAKKGISATKQANVVLVLAKVYGARNTIPQLGGWGAHAQERGHGGWRCWIRLPVRLVTCDRRASDYARWNDACRRRMASGSTRSLAGRLDARASARYVPLRRHDQVEVARVHVA